MTDYVDRRSPCESCGEPADGAHCEACLAQLRRQEPDPRTVMDGRGPRGW